MFKWPKLGDTGDDQGSAGCSWCAITDIWDAISSHSWLVTPLSSPLLRTGHLMCLILACDHTPEATQTGPGPWATAWYQHSSNPCTAPCSVPWSSWISFIIPRVTTHRLDKYLLDVFLSWLWSLMPLTLLAPDSWELSLHLWIVGDRKSHFIHDNVPDWRLLIKRRLVPLNQTSEECRGLGLGQAQTRIKFLKQIFCSNINRNSLAQPSVASVAWMNKIWQLQPGPAGLAIVNSFYGLCCNNRSVL